MNESPRQFRSVLAAASMFFLTSCGPVVDEYETVTCGDMWDCIEHQMYAHAPVLLDRSEPEVIEAEDEMLQDWEYVMTTCFDRQRINELLMDCEEAWDVNYEEVCSPEEETPEVMAELLFVRERLIELGATDWSPDPIVVDSDGAECVVEGYEL